METSSARRLISHQYPYLNFVSQGVVQGLGTGERNHLKICKMPGKQLDMDEFLIVVVVSKLAIFPEDARMNQWLWRGQKNRRGRPRKNTDEVSTSIF